MKLPRLPFLPRGGVVGIAALGLVLGCRPRGGSAPAAPLPPMPVHVTTVSGEPRVGTEEVVGTVRTRLRSSVEPKVAGRVQVLPVVPGQRVRKGETLAELDDRDIRTRLDSAQAVLEQATRDFQRVSRLRQEGAATVADEDALRAHQRVATAGVAEVESLLAHTRILAPFDGVITRKLADVGDLAAPGKALVEIEDPTQLRFEADLPEALVEGVHLGSRLQVRIGAAAEPLPGIVSEIAPMAESTSRTYLVKLDLPTAPSLRAGQFGRVAVPTGEIRVPHVPTNAVVQRGQLEYVFVVDAGRAALRLIRSGRRFEQRVEVVSGLDAGETVVRDTPPGLRDSQPVEVRP